MKAWRAEAGGSRVLFLVPVPDYFSERAGFPERGLDVGYK